MKCCICGKDIESARESEYPLYVAGETLAACCAGHQQEAMENRGQCYLAADAQGWIADQESMPSGGRRTA